MKLRNESGRSVELLEAELLSIVAEAPPAHHQAVLANEAVRVRAHSAAHRNDNY